MSLLFLVPKITSKNPKRALRGYRVRSLNMTPEDLAALLRREDVVIRDQIFDDMLARRERRRNIFDGVRNDPSHPYYARLKQTEDREAADQAAREQQIRKKQFSEILRLAESSERDKWIQVPNAVQTYVDDPFHFKHYEVTEDEKHVLGNIMFDYAMNHDEHWCRDMDELLLSRLKGLMCVPLIKDHLMEMPHGTPVEMIREAMNSMDLTDEQKRKVCLRYKFLEGDLVTPCEIGNHRYVLVETTTEENYEDWTRPYKLEHYRCRDCGHEDNVVIRD